jgi:anti-sigma B factor antagonist
MQAGSVAAPIPPSTLLCTAVPDGPRHVRLVLAGVLDLSSAHQLRTAVTAVVRDDVPDRIDVDLTAVRSLDAGGVQALCDSHTVAGRAGCRLVASCPQPLVYRVLQVAGLLRTLAVARPPSSRPAAGDVAAAARAMRTDAIAAREAATEARERARAVLADDEARRMRMRALWNRR